MDTPTHDNAQALAKGALRLPKNERLHHRSLVNHLFAKSDALYAYPLRIFRYGFTNWPSRHIFHLHVATPRLVANTPLRLSASMVR